MSYKFTRATKNILSYVTILAIVLGSIPAFPNFAEAATPVIIFEDGFGVGSDSATITGWEKHEDATIVREGQASGDEDVESPDGDRFAKISEDSNDGGPHDGYICREIDAEELTNLTLSYYWNGDFEAESAGGGGPDLGIVEARDNGNGDANCGAEGGWDELQSHDLTQHSDSWHQVSELDISDFDGTTFTIRFRNESSADDEWFRVDGVKIEGEEMEEGAPIFCDPSQKPGGKSIAEWHDDNGFDGSDCFEYELMQQCGLLNVQFTENETPYSYSFNYVIGSTTPELVDYAGDGTLPVTFTEDEYNGSVDVTYYVVGAEKDYFVGSDVPNIWDGNGTTVTVDTDCEDDVEKTEETIVVTGDTAAGENQEGWLFNRDVNTATEFEFNTDEAVIGDGSLNVFPIDGSLNGDADKFIAEYFWLGEIADLETFSYDFKIGSGGDASDENHFYLNVYANFAESSDTKYYDCRYNVVPTTGSTASFTTLTFDPTESYPVTKSGSSPHNCPAVPADMNDEGDGATIRAFAINLGDSSANDTDLDGYFDNVVLDTETKKTTFDFEPVPPQVTIVANKVICELESDLPNYQDGGGANITASTAQDWVDQSDGSCWLEPDWDFQWYPDTILHDGVGDDTLTGEKGGLWTTFSGTTTVDITDIDGLSIREVLQEGYIPFTYLTEGNANTDNITAEFSCSTGGKNYDNLEWAQNVEDGDVVQCVAFNVPVETDEPGQCVATATADLNETPSQGNVVDTITEFVIDGITYSNGDSFDMFVAGDADAGDGSVGDEPEVQIERTSDGFELYFYGNGSQDVMEFSGSFTLDNVNASGASITAGSEPLEFAGSWPDEINIDTVTGEVTFTLYTNTGNDSFVVSGLVKDCPEEPTQCVDQLDGDWADNVEEFNQGNTKNGAAVSANRSNEEDVLGEADWSTGLTDGFVSLGFGGSIVVSFDSYVPNVDGDDISIHEATNGIYPDETALIEVSQNGTDWYEVGTANNDGVSYFDFDGTGLAWIKYVRITDTSNTALHGGDADGFDLDAIDATETVCEEPEMPEICSVVVVSDDSNEVEETEGFAKILSFVHTAWTAVITDADWIWGDDPVETPEVEETQTFVKNFEWSGGIASAILDIASDNHYTVYLNDVEVASSTDDNNFQIGTQDQIDMSAYVVEGENELKIEVVNLAGSSNPQSNPAGLKYNLTITSNETGDSCMYAPEEVDPSLEITKPETEDQVLSGEYTFKAEYVDADDNYDNVQWAIRVGTCNAGTNTVAGNVDGFNTDFDWDGASFSSTIDMSGWDEDEYCFVVNPTEDGGTNFRETRWFTLEHPEPTQCLIVSDTTTIVVENNDYAVETWDDHSNWTHDISDATWIWDSVEVVDPEATTTRTFKETFIVSGLEEAKFYIAADNTYSVYINDMLAYEQLNSNNYQTHDEYTDVADYLVEGENELVVVVTNIPNDGSSPKSNPAGVLFKLKMEVSGDGGQCVSTTEPEDEPLTYTLDGYKWNDENGDGVWGEGENAIAGWTIYVQNGEVLSTTTDSNGYYYFEVEEDNWEVYEATSTNWTQTGIVITTDYEGDGYIDTDSCIFEIDTEESESPFGTLQCDFGNNENEEPVISVASVSGGGGSTSYGGTGYFGRGGGDTTIPNQRVLGASTDTCEQYLTETIMPGRNNNPSEVIRLQEFLNSFEGYNLEVNGIYDIATQNAVGNFQEKYSDNVLAPWGLDSRTLNVYYTTRKTVNEIYCKWAVEFPLSQTEQSEIDWFRGLGLAYRQSGGNSAAVPTSNDSNNNGGDKGQESGQSDDNAETSNKSNKEDSNVNSQAANTISGNGEGGFFAGIWNWLKGLFSW